MTKQLQPLNGGQSLVYTRTNIRRAFSDFDDSDIAGMYRQDDQLLVTRTDGTTQNFAAKPIANAYQSFTGRLPNFFSYLGPNHRGPSIWRNNCYVLLKGWHYQRQGMADTFNAIAQRKWIDKFTLINDENTLISLLDRFDLGYLISPDGKLKQRTDFGLGSDLDHEDDPEPEPFCSCGSFRRQQSCLSAIRREIPDYEPCCKHIAWFKRFRDYLVKRSQLIEAQRGHNATKATAWFYAPPEIGQEHGRFSIIFTKHGQNAPITKWQQYRSDEVFTEDDAWDLFDSMIDNGYVPFPHTALPSIAHAFKQS